MQQNGTAVPDRRKHEPEKRKEAQTQFAPRVYQPFLPMAFMGASNLDVLEVAPMEEEQTCMGR